MNERFIPLTTGRVALIRPDEVVLTEVCPETIAFFAAGDNNQQVLAEFRDAMVFNPDASVSALTETCGESDDLPVVERQFILKKHAEELIQHATPDSPSYVELVVDGMRVVDIDPELVPDGTRVGQTLGVWATTVAQASPGHAPAPGKPVVVDIQRLA